MTPVFYKFFVFINAAIKRNQVSCVIPVCTRSQQIVIFLRNEGFINNFNLSPGSAEIFFKFNESRPVLKQIFSISKPGRRVHISFKSLPLLMSRNIKSKGNASYYFLLHTGDGIITHQQAINFKRGGELLCGVVC